MSDLEHEKQGPIAQDTNEQAMMALTRRTILTGAAATAAAAVGSVSAQAAPLAPNQQTDKQLDLFLELSAVLTGVAKEKLAPGVDPIKIKLEYFAQAKKEHAFAQLLDLFSRNRNASNVGDIICNKSEPNVRFLARSVMLMWYLGAWYDPKDLRRLADSQRPEDEKVLPVIISPKAYTQGWVWRVAQSHPMGASEWTFGHWANKPPTLDSFIKSA